MVVSLCDSRPFCQRGSNYATLTFFSFLGKKGSKYRSKLVIIGVPAKRHCRCWSYIKSWFGSFVIFQESEPILLKNFIFVICQGGGGGGRDPYPPSGSAHGETISLIFGRNFHLYPSFEFVSMHRLCYC